MKFLLFMIINLMLGCGYNNSKLNDDGGKAGGNTGNTPQNATAIDFSIIKSKIFDTSCIKCHSQAGGNKGAVNLETYANVKPILQTILAEVNGGNMPPSGALATSLQDLLSAWIKAGAPEFVTNQPEPTNPVNPGNPNNPSPVNPIPTNPPPANTQVNYQLVNEQIFKPKCLKCHSQAGGNKGKVNLETYVSIKKFLKVVVSEVNRGSMPPSGPLSAELKTLLNNWVSAGALEFMPANDFDVDQSQSVPGEDVDSGCDNHNQLVRENRAINLDRKFYFDTENKEFKRRPKACEEEKQNED